MRVALFDGIVGTRAFAEPVVELGGIQQHGERHVGGRRLKRVRSPSRGISPGAAAYADSRLRPLARRLAITARPPTVAMRLRKP